MPPISKKSFQANSTRLYHVLGIALLVLIAVGCQRQGDVTGKVLYKSKPLVFGTVFIEGSDGNAGQGNIAQDGSFTVRGIATGTAKVAVNSPNPKGIALIPPKDPAKKQEPYPDIAGWFEIPNQFGSVDTSGLTYKIKGGLNEIDIELK